VNVYDSSIREIGLKRATPAVALLATSSELEEKDKQRERERERERKRKRKREREKETRNLFLSVYILDHMTHS